MNFVQENVLSNTYEKMGLNQQAFTERPHIGVDFFNFTGLAAADLSYFHKAVDTFILKRNNYSFLWWQSVFFCLCKSLRVHVETFQSEIIAFFPRSRIKWISKIYPIICFNQEILKDLVLLLIII